MKELHLGPVSWQVRAILSEPAVLVLGEADAPEVDPSLGHVRGKVRGGSPCEPFGVAARTCGSEHEEKRATHVRSPLHGPTSLSRSRLARSSTSTATGSAASSRSKRGW